MPFNIILVMTVYILASSFTPGPGNILALNTMLKYGFNKGKNLILGIGLGYGVIQLICTLTVYGLNQYFNSVMQIIKYLGAIYLVYLAFQIIKSKAEISENKQSPTFITGFLMQLINIKIYFYSATLLSVYIVPYFKSPLNIFIMDIVVIGIGFSATLTWALLGLKLKKIYISYFRCINLILGIFLLYCAFNILRG